MGAQFLSSGIKSKRLEVERVFRRVCLKGGYKHRLAGPIRVKKVLRTHTHLIFPIGSVGVSKKMTFIIMMMITIMTNANRDDPGLNLVWQVMM